MATEWSDPLNAGGYKHQSTDYEVAGKSGKKYPLYISYTSAGSTFPTYVYSVKIGDKYYQVGSGIHATTFNKGQLPTNSDIEKEIKFGELRQVKINDESNNPTNAYSNIGIKGSTPTQKSKEMKAGTYALDNKSTIAYTTDGKNYYYYDGSKKVPITDTNKLTLNDSYTNAKSIADSIMNTANSTLSSLFGTSTSKDTVYKEQVGTTNINGKQVPVYTDGAGNYYYETSNESHKIDNVSTISFSNEYLQSVKDKNVPNYLNNIGDTGNITSVSANPPKLMSAAELADLYGINYDYDYILNMLNEGTDAYLNEMTEKVRQVQSDNLRNQSALYQQYLDTLRKSRANAVNTGINRGALAAQELGQYLLTQQQIGSNQSDINQKIYDLYNAAITEKARNKMTALDKYNALGTAFMNAGATFNGNDVQRYTADLGAASQIASSINNANAAKYGSALQAQATLDAAWLNAMSNPANLPYVTSQINNTNADTNYKKAQAKAVEDK